MKSHITIIIMMTVMLVENSDNSKLVVSKTLKMLTINPKTKKIKDDVKRRILNFPINISIATHTHTQTQRRTTNNKAKSFYLKMVYDQKFH